MATLKPKDSTMYKTLRICCALLLAVSLGGCLLINPYHGQVLSTRTQSLPFQAWTASTGGSMLVECMPTNRFGPETSPHGSWTQIDTVPISTSASRDLSGGLMYSASKTISLPQSCWYLNSSNGWYYSSLRVIQTNYFNSPRYEYFTVDRAGVECTGSSVGEKGVWTAWSEDGCNRKYTNGNPVRWITMRTQG